MLVVIVKDDVIDFVIEEFVDWYGSLLEEVEGFVVIVCLCCWVVRVGFIDVVMMGLNFWIVFVCLEDLIKVCL